MSDLDMALAKADGGPAGEAVPPKPKPVRTPVANKPRRNLSIFLREWHKRAGLFAFLFMGWLGFSGILINQSPSWGYDTDRIYWSWVMWLYSLEPEPPQSGFAADGHWLALTPEGTVLDGKPVLPPVKLPLGLVAGGSAEQPLLFIANAEHVAVVTLDGARFDELRSPILPVSTIRRIGSVGGVAGSVAVQDLDAFQSLDAGSNWTPVDPARVQWSDAVELPPAERDRLLLFSRPYVTLEHILVDAHSGALFGRGGVYVINTVGIAALWLAISGVWMWWRASRSRRPQGQK
ncbi:MAG: PepSY domain-containing protein [Panacagrimonas sp.]